MKLIIAFLIVFSFGFEKKEIRLKDQVLKVEVAKSEKERSQGLMNRKELKGIDGMLFIFPQEKILSFWMKNTLIPLSIAFFNKDKILIDIKKMTPHKGPFKPPTYKSSSPAQFALEVPLGWFEQNQIGLGSRLSWKTN